MTPDEELTKQIEDALLRDQHVSGQKIHVSVVGGVVTLRGSVQSYRRKLTAQEIAASFSDCRGVANDLAVVPAESVSDETVATCVRTALDAHAGITKETITVSVEAGTVSLSGTVGTLWERVLAEDIALGVRGARGVKNRLLVDPAEQEEDEALSQVIATTLAGTQGLQDTGIRVAVSGGCVVLAGAVAAAWQKEAAEIVARRFQPLWITNEIVVVGDPPATRSEG